MKKPTGFHVRHDLRPQLTHELLLVLKTASMGLELKEIQTLAAQHGLELRHRKSYTKLLLSLRELNVIKQQAQNVCLSHIGETLAVLSLYQPHLLAECIHFLYMTSWDKETNNRVSWSYKTVCQLLWQNAPGTVDKDRLVRQVGQKAEEAFAVGDISFSVSSIAGIFQWLAQLQPPCLQENHFILRPYCPLETFMLAINHLYQTSGKQTYLPISPTLRQQVCQICLIPTEAFFDLLQQTDDCFPQLHIRRERGDRYAIHNFGWHHLLEE